MSRIMINVLFKFVECNTVTQLFDFNELEH